MISINIYEIIFQCLNFVALIWLLNKFFVAPLQSFLDKRTRTIKDDIEQAELKRSESEKLQSEQKELLKKSQKEAKSIRESAEEAALKEREVVIHKAKDEATSLIDHARKELEQDVKRAKAALTEQVATLSVQLSGQLIKKNLDSKENTAILTEFIEKHRN